MSAPKVLVRITREQVIYAAIPADEIGPGGFVQIDGWTARDWCDKEDSADVVATVAASVPQEWLTAIPYEDESDSDDTIAQRLDAGTLTIGVQS